MVATIEKFSERLLNWMVRFKSSVILSTKLASAKCENETLQTEFDLLLERNTQVSKKLENSNTAWMSKLEIVLQEKDQIIFANKDVISCLQAENEKLCETHKVRLVTTWFSAGDFFFVCHFVCAISEPSGRVSG